MDDSTVWVWRMENVLPRVLSDTVCGSVEQIEFIEIKNNKKINVCKVLVYYLHTEGF